MRVFVKPLCVALLATGLGACGVLPINHTPDNDEATIKSARDNKTDQLTVVYAGCYKQQMAPYIASRTFPAGEQNIIARMVWKHENSPRQLVAFIPFQFTLEGGAEYTFKYQREDKKVKVWVADFNTDEAVTEPVETELGIFEVGNDNTRWRNLCKKSSV
ncbi:hypothetical protein CWI84_06290 [Idiomarina tyrosinivorans]|uniref:Lipoprotein n=1 Tax=Idiomarina tyrosinivorans TaxID=1445662 RepID=A0A432ZQR0_9GAMM|nr:hypothetical protein [Idiomarina tyrosinivorans]RUO80237.1 hypothetical protein CWI84_06290 [Idiomarina tyrosinivorans]